uniref:Tail protein n=1 Tax=viral metagenome TaxID=1070528 RepID=A0A6M3J9P5_9ZZZZ
MTFSSTLADREIFGTRWVTWGTFDSTGETGGNIDTGLGLVESFMAVYTGSSAATAPITVDESFPLTGSAVTIICDTSGAGIWFAVGYM